MENPSRNPFVLTSITLLLAVYSAALTFGLFRVQGKAEALATQQRAELVATHQKVEEVLNYLESVHGEGDGDSKDLARMKIVMAEHEQKLFLLQDTLNKLFSVAE